MKALMFVLGICMVSTGAIAAQGCPDRFEEVPMENMLLTAESCPTGTMSYYEIDPICNAHVN